MEYIYIYIYIYEQAWGDGESNKMREGNIGGGKREGGRGQGAGGRDLGVREQHTEEEDGNTRGVGIHVNCPWYEDVVKIRFKGRVDQM